MTDETNTTTTSTPTDFGPWDAVGKLGAGSLAIIAGLGAMLWGLLGKRLNDEKASDYERESAFNLQLAVAQQARGVERDEEKHALHTRWLDEQYRTQVDIQATARAERLANEARCRAEKVRERYYAEKIERETKLDAERSMLIERQAVVAMAHADYLRSQTPEASAGLVELDEVIRLAKRQFEPHLGEHPKFGEFIEVLSTLAENAKR